MKKFGFLFIATSLICFSCKRDYPCTCTETYSYDDVAYEKDEVFVVHASKKTKQSECESKADLMEKMAPNSVINCKAQ